MRHAPIGSLSFVLILSLFFAGPVLATESLSKQDIESAISSPSLDTTINSFLSKLPQVVIAEQGNAIYYVIEGDLLLDREGVESYLMSHRQGAAPADGDAELLVMTHMGQMAIWPRGHRNLTYAVARNSFPSQAQYQEIVAQMRTAASDWEFCAECGLTITHRQDLDATPQPGQVTFIVHYAPNESRFIAAAFFPHYPPSMRQIIIAPSFFSTSISHAGVLRHELGHVLGYRHDHIAGVPGCSMEDGNWIPVSPYNPRSVMHYLCGGGGTMTMELQETDKAGHRAAYGR